MSQYNGAASHTGTEQVSTTANNNTQTPPLDACFLSLYTHWKQRIPCQCVVY